MNDDLIIKKGEDSLTSIAEKLLGKTSPPILGQELTPDREDLGLPLQAGSECRAFCRQCGMMGEVSLGNHVLFGLNTGEDMTGKYISVSHCPMCSKEDEWGNAEIRNI